MWPEKQWLREKEKEKEREGEREREKGFHLENVFLTYLYVYNGKVHADI
jgi:hypothetical protein